MIISNGGVVPTLMNCNLYLTKDRHISSQNMLEDTLC